MRHVKGKRITRKKIQIPGWISELEEEDFLQGDPAGIFKKFSEQE
jgi:hypothetical protein